MVTFYLPLRDAERFEVMSVKIYKHLSTNTSELHLPVSAEDGYTGEMSPGEDFLPFHQPDPLSWH